MEYENIEIKRHKIENPISVSIHKGLLAFFCIYIYNNGKIKHQKNPPRRFLKSKNVGAMRKIPFCDKDAIGRENKKCSRYAFF